MFFKRKKEKQKTVEELAREGDAEAQYKLGMTFYKNETRRSFAYYDAVLWLEKAAAGGYKKANLTLGEIYQWGGYGVQSDPKKAVEYYLKAYNFCEGDEKAEVENALASCYMCMWDEENALVWGRRYAERGSEDGIGSYGCMLCDFERYDEAVEVLKRLDETNGRYDIFVLGECYFYGRGVAEDKAEAKRLWQIAADNGIEEAQEALEKYFK